MRVSDAKKTLRSFRAHVTALHLFRHQKVRLLDQGLFFLNYMKIHPISAPTFCQCPWLGTQTARPRAFEVSGTTARVKSLVCSAHIRTKPILRHPEVPCVGMMSADRKQLVLGAVGSQVAHGSYQGATVSGLPNEDFWHRSLVVPRCGACLFRGKPWPFVAQRPGRQMVQRSAPGMHAQRSFSIPAA